jgi:hypothetical protein
MTATGTAGSTARLKKGPLFPRATTVPTRPALFVRATRCGYAISSRSGRRRGLDLVEECVSLSCDVRGGLIIARASCMQRKDIRDALVWQAPNGQPRAAPQQLSMQLLGRGRDHRTDPAGDPACQTARRVGARHRRRRQPRDGARVCELIGLVPADGYPGRDPVYRAPRAAAAACAGSVFPSAPSSASPVGAAAPGPPRQRPMRTSQDASRTAAAVGSCSRRCPAQPRTRRCRSPRRPC